MGNPKLRKSTIGIAIAGGLAVLAVVDRKSVV